MTSGRLFDHQESLFTEPKTQQSTIVKDSPATRLASSILLMLFIYYIANHITFFRLRLSTLTWIWNWLVYIIPSFSASALDRQQGWRVSARAKKSKDSPSSKNRADKGRAIMRIFGSENKGIFKMFKAGSFSEIGNAGTPLVDGLPGLGNWDNSCYQNSVLQGLASINSLSAFLRKNAADNTSHPTKTALKEIIDRLNNPLNAGKRLWTPAELKSMSSWQQQDAQEYFSKVLDEIEKENCRLTQIKSAGAGLADFSGLVHCSNRNRTAIKGKPIQKNELKYDNDNSASKTPTSLYSKTTMEGLLAQRVGCLQCGFVEGLSLIPFNCVTLPLGKHSIYDIRDCLDFYTSLEPISEVECSKCTLLLHRQQLERLVSKSENPKGAKAKNQETRFPKKLLESLTCRLEAVNEALKDEDFSENTLLKRCLIPVKSRVKTTKSKQAVIARAPKALVIHLNRSVFDEVGGIQRKNYADVRFPEVLTLDPWCLGTLSSSVKTTINGETWTVDPSKSMLIDRKAKEGEMAESGYQNIYALRAIITHYGRHENGHYICYRMDPKTQRHDEKRRGAWYRLSDDEVSKVDQNIVLGQGGVFMLFYEQLESTTPELLVKTSLQKQCDSGADIRTTASGKVAISQPLNFESSLLQSISNNTGPTPCGISVSSPKLRYTSPIDNFLDSSDTESETCNGIGTRKRQPNPLPVLESTIARGESEVKPPAIDHHTPKMDNRRIRLSVRTAGPRDKMTQPGNAMSSVSSMVAAN